jgi:hypothetical protein
LFTSQSASGVSTFTAGTVSFNTSQPSTTTTCNETGLAPGDSSGGYLENPADTSSGNPGNGAFLDIYKDASSSPCMIRAAYTGTLNAYAGLDVTVTSTSAAGVFYSLSSITSDCVVATPVTLGYMCNNFALINNTDPNSATQQFQIEANNASNGNPPKAPTVADINLSLITCSETNPFTSNAVQTCTFTTTQPVEITAVTGEGSTGQVASQVADQLDFYLPKAAGNGYQGSMATITETFVAVQCSNNASTINSADPTNAKCYGAGPASWTQVP